MAYVTVPGISPTLQQVLFGRAPTAIVQPTIVPSPRPVATPISGTVIEPLTGTLYGPTGQPPFSVADAGSGGGAMTGVSDLFSGIGNAFANLTHPGTSASVPGTTQTTSPSSGFLLLGIGALILLIFLTRK